MNLTFTIKNALMSDPQSHGQSMSLSYIKQYVKCHQTIPVEDADIIAHIEYLISEKVIQRSPKDFNRYSLI